MAPVIGFPPRVEQALLSNTQASDRRGPSANEGAWLDGLDELSVCDRERRVSSKLWLPEPPRASSRLHSLRASGPVPPVEQAHTSSQHEQGEGPVPGQTHPGSRWATSEAGLSCHRLAIPPGTWLVGVHLRTAPHNGIIDIRLAYRCADGSSGTTSWAVGCEGGRVHVVECDGRPYAMGVTVRHLPREGLVNLQVIRAGGLRTPWAVPKVVGEVHWAGLRAGAKLTGVEVRAAPGYGLVDIRALSR